MKGRFDDVPFPKRHDDAEKQCDVLERFFSGVCPLVFHEADSSCKCLATCVATEGLLFSLNAV